MKEAAWKSIENEFNARSGGTFRSTKTLKVKYEGLKRTVRKKSAAIRSELYRTGGGQNKAPILDNVEEQIKAMISLSTDGLQSIYDSDILPQTKEDQDIIDDTKVAEFTGISVIDTDIPEVVESETTQNQVLLLVTNECEPLQPTTSTDIVPEEKNIITGNKNDNALLDTPTRNIITPSTANKKWDVTSRRNLKSRKHPALIANVPKKTLFDELTQAKLELVQLQKKFLEEEIIEKKKVWEFEENERKKEAEFKEKERKWKEEEYKLKLQK
uniref:Regulatory protein zeste n=1 Tax=Heliothis virescens TaxID=7102 RepID=A0A2A4JYT3_HELVI